MFLGYFCKQICCQQLSKIAQSGHTNFISSFETIFAGNESCQNQKRDLRNISLFIISGQYCKQFTPFKILAPAGRWDTYPCCSGQPCSRANRLECFIEYICQKRSLRDLFTLTKVKRFERRKSSSTKRDSLPQEFPLVVVQGLDREVDPQHFVFRQSSLAVAAVVVIVDAAQMVVKVVQV